MTLAYIGTYTQDAPDGASPGRAAQGIHVLEADRPPWQERQVVGMPNPSYLAWHPAGDLLYALNEIESFDGQPRGAIQVLRADVDGQLAHVVTLPLANGATSPAHLAVDTSGRHLVVSAYGGGQFNVFRLDERGLPAEISDTQRHAGQGAVAGRQDGPHAHQALPLTDGRHWLGCDLGLDSVTLWCLDDGLFHTRDVWKSPPGSGPRHSAVHPAGRHMYVVHELTATLVHLMVDLEAGRLVAADTSVDADAQVSSRPIGDAAPMVAAYSMIDLMPAGYTGARSGGALLIHPGGKWLFASTRRTGSADARADSVSVWEIDACSGALTLIMQTSAGINFPRAMTVSDDGNTLYVLNQKGGNIVAFTIDAASGALSDGQIVAEVPTPVCLAFRPHPLR